MKVAPICDEDGSYLMQMVVCMQVNSTRECVKGLHKMAVGKYINKSTIYCNTEVVFWQQLQSREDRLK